MTKVIVEVLGGVADVTQSPDDVEVVIVDHDNGDAWCAQCGKNIGDQCTCPWCGWQGDPQECPNCGFAMVYSDHCTKCGHVPDED